jgi:ElaB/YqjD/DUF883 family membrane-anchored ribosome-binding protein
MPGRRRASNKVWLVAQRKEPKLLMRKGESMKVASIRGVSWEDGQDSAVRLWKQARETGEDFLYQLNRKVRRHPWKAVGVALGAGVLLGALISRGVKD